LHFNGKEIIRNAKVSSALCPPGQKKQKNFVKKLAQAKKNRTFAPAITAKFLRFTEGGLQGKRIKNFFQKACQKQKRYLPLRPAKAEVHWSAGGFWFSEGVLGS
jgi:hypothetical protein